MGRAVSFFLTAVTGAPVVLGAAGFAPAGITAGSLAASMMSAFATASGGGVAAGGVVATLQSVGAVGGLDVVGTAVVGGAGAALGAATGK